MTELEKALRLVLKSVSENWALQDKEFDFTEKLHEIIRKPLQEQIDRLNHELINAKSACNLWRDNYERLKLKYEPKP